MRRLLLPCLLLAGCADQPDRYPSLSPRPIEKLSLAEPAPKPVPAAAPDAKLDAQIADLRAQGETAMTAFSKAAADAETKVAIARGLPEDSPGWIEAQAALARLDDAQSPFAFLRSSLERIAADRATAGQPPYPALDKAIAEAAAHSDQVRERAATIEAALKS